MKFLTKKIVSFALSAVMVAGLLPSSEIFADDVNAVSAKAAASVPEGFVYTDGTNFMMDRNTYYYGGTNCYYLTYKSKMAVDNVLNDAKDMGLNVIRIWGNLDVGAITDETLKDGVTPVFEGNNDNNQGVGTKDGVYFQYWDPELKKPVVNEGANGLRRLDYVIKKAEENNMKLIITFTNYWEAFGGMGQYIKYYQMLQGETPDNNKLDETAVCEFYTNETIKQWYKDYIKTLVNHTNYYTGEKLKDSEAVFAWELANEPRCTIDGNGSTFCNDHILYHWVEEMSAYVKSVDPNHMVSVGDEGFYNMGYQEANAQKLPSAAYSGYYGVDFDKLMTIDTIDFGTPHMYVDQWGFKDGDDLEWIKRHAQSAAKANKPVVLEEFGLTNKKVRDSHYQDWLAIMTGDYYEGIEYQGFNYWMIASWIDETEQPGLGDGRHYYDDYDQYTVYGPAEIDAKVGSPKARQLLIDAAAKMNEKNINNLAEISADTVDRSNAVNVTADLYVMLGQFEELTCDGNSMIRGADYAVNGNTVTINKDYFKTLELGKHTFKFVFTEGNSPAPVITVTDSSIIDPELSAYSLDIDKSPFVVKDADVTMTLNNNEFRGISNGKTALVEGTDYTVSGSVVTFKAEYLASLATGETVLVFDFYEGNDKTLTLNVTDSSTRVWTGSVSLGNWQNTLTVNKNLGEWLSGKLQITLKNASGCQLQLNYLDSKGTAVKIVDYTNEFTADEYVFTLSQSDFDKLRTGTGLTIKGKNATIVAIDVIDGVRDSNVKPDDSSSEPDSSSVADSSSKEDSSSMEESSSEPDSSSVVEPVGDAQEVMAIIDDSINSNVKYITGSASDVRVDGDFINNKSGATKLSLALPFTVDDLNSDYTVKIYAKGQSSPKAFVSDANGNYFNSKSITEQKWTELKTDPATIIVKGSQFGKTGIYYAGITANEYINFYKITVTKSPSKGDDSSKTDDSSLGEVTGTPQLVSTNLTLTGIIGANAYYTIPSGYINSSYKVEAIFTSKGLDDLRVPLNKSNTKTINGQKAYAFTLPVKSCDMSKRFTVKLVVSTSSGKEVATTASSSLNLNSYINSLANVGNADQKAFAEAMRTYGYYSQKMFNTTDRLPSVTLVDLSDVTYSTVRKYSAKTVALNGQIKGEIYGTSLYLNSGTGIRSYVSNLADDVNPNNLYMQYTLNGKSKRVKAVYSETSKSYYGEISDIAANRLSTIYDICFCEGSTPITNTIQYGAYSYIYSTLRSSKSVDEQNLVKALYKYSIAAETLIPPVGDLEDDLDTTVTDSTRENFGDYVGVISNVDINGTKLYSQDDLVKEFGNFGNLYDKSLYDNGKGSDVAIAFCGWNLANYIEDPDLAYKMNFFTEGGEYGARRMTFIPTYFLDTYEEGIMVNGKNTLTPDQQAEIMAEAIKMGVSINYRLHIDPQRFAPEAGSYSKVDTAIPGSQWWRGEFTKVNPMGDDYLAMIDQGFESLEKTFKLIGNTKLSEPIRFDIGAELMTSIKNYTGEWIELVEYCKAKRDANPLLRDNVIIGYNFCHHIEYLIEIENHDDYFERINGTGITYKDRQDLLFVDDMPEENRLLLGEFIKSLDSFSISQYMPMDIFVPADMKSTDVATTPEDVRDALLTHEQNFLQKILIGKLGIAPEEIPPMHLGEYGMGIKGLTAPNVWDRTAWTDNELATYEAQRKHMEIAIKGLLMYMQDERSVAKTLALWISGAPYDFINFYPGMNIGDEGHGYPGEAAYNANAAQTLIDYWHGETIS